MRTVMTNEKLNYSEQLFLILFKEFYDRNYICNNAEKLHDGILAEHLQAQKVAYLFSQANISVDDYTFIWDKKGPFSVGLQMMLKSLDKKSEDVEAFYQRYDENKNEYIEDLLTEKQIRKMKLIVDKLSKYIRCGDFKNVCNAAEMIGSLVYLNQSVMPSCNFQDLLKELSIRKSYLELYTSADLWSALKETGLVSTWSY